MILIALVLAQLAWAGKEIYKEPTLKITESEYTSALRIARECMTGGDDFYDQYPDELEVDVWILQLIEKDIREGNRDVRDQTFFISAYVCMDLIRMEVLMGIPYKKKQFELK